MKNNSKIFALSIIVLLLSSIFAPLFVQQVSATINPNGYNLCNTLQYWTWESPFTAQAITADKREGNASLEFGYAGTAQDKKVYPKWVNWSSSYIWFGFWAKVTSSDAYNSIFFGQYNPANGHYADIKFWPGGTLQVGLEAYGASGTQQNMTVLITIAVGSWYWYQIGYNSTDGYVRAFVNGTSMGILKSLGITFSTNTFARIHSDISGPTPGKTVLTDFWLGSTNTMSSPEFSMVNDSEISNLDCGDWLIAELRYYSFFANMSFVPPYQIDVIGFSFNDTANNRVRFYFKNSTSTITLLNDSIAFASIAYNYTYSVSGSTVIYTFSVWLKKSLIDSWDVDLYFFENDTAGTSTGWGVVHYDYFNIYSRGGLEKLTTSGNAGRIAGGEFFNLYAYNNSYAYSEIYWRKLVHVKLLLSIKWDHGSQPSGYPIPTFEIGWNYYAKGNWVEYESNGFSIYLSLVGFAYGADWQYAEWYYAMRRDGAIIVQDYFWTWYDVEQETSQMWIDLWFNSANASSIFGVRVSAYWYAVKNSADWLHRTFTGNDWGVYWSNKSSFVNFGTIPDLYGNTTYTSQIEMVKMWVKLWQGPNPDYDGIAQIVNIQQFDYTFSTDQYNQGISTPTFEPPRTPAMPAGGFLGVLASWLSGIINALAPVFNYAWSGVIYVLDQVIGFVTGQQGVFSGFVSMVSNIANSVVSFMGYIVSNFVTFFTAVVNTITWFFGTFFSVIWGIIYFVFVNPAFNVISAVTSIFGIAFAWLAGTAYTNGWGQVYDFSYLSNFSFMGLTGGVVIFALIFLFGFFIQILACLSSMSLGPILVPVHLFVTFIMFIIQIIQTIFDIVYRVIHVLVAIAQALASLLPF